MLILYVAMKYDYGKPEQGYSFEHYNFYDSLLHMGNDILYFDFVTLMRGHGRDWMNRRLLEVAKAEKPDMMFTVLFTDEFEAAVVREISDNTDTLTLNWFCDDHWRFDNYSRYWAPCFNWVVTTAKSALPKYASVSYRNVIKSQWACNHFLYRKLDLPLEFDVTFVGQPHGNRRALVQVLRDAGVNIHVWGSGWESGRLSQEGMIRVFNQSRINLNLSNASASVSIPRMRAINMARACVSRVVNAVPFGLRLKTTGKRCLSAIRHGAADTKTRSRSNTDSRLYPDQIKARNFEIPGCGGFLLTGPAEDLADYYQIGKEIVCFEDEHDLLEKVRYYLGRENERAAIARAGLQRTLREHTYAHRFAEIFRHVGLWSESLDRVLKGNVLLGHTEEVL